MLIDSAKDVRVLVVGCGSIGGRHLRNLRQMGVREFAACDARPEPLESVRDQTSTTYTDLGEALSGFEPDAVMVCTTPDRHVPLAQTAADTGAHVFIEKPVGLDRAGIETLSRTVACKGLICQVGYNLRFHPALTRMRELVHEGVVGRPTSARFHFGLYLPTWWAHRDYRTTYIVKEAVGGGLLFDVSHEVDCARWILGDVTRVSATGGVNLELEMDSADVIHAILDFESGAVAILDIDAWRPQYTRSWNVVGTEGEIDWNCSADRTDTSAGRLMTRSHENSDWRVVEVSGRADEAYSGEVAAFLRSVVTGEKPLVDLNEGVRTLDVLLAAKKSLVSRQSERVESEESMLV